MNGMDSQKETTDNWFAFVADSNLSVFLCMKIMCNSTQ